MVVKTKIQQIPKIHGSVMAEQFSYCGEISLALLLNEGANNYGNDQEKGFLLAN